MWWSGPDEFEDIGTRDAARWSECADGLQLTGQELGVVSDRSILSIQFEGRVLLPSRLAGISSGNHLSFAVHRDSLTGIRKILGLKQKLNKQINQ